jgi:hypothetical protein
VVHLPWKQPQLEAGRHAVPGCVCMIVSHGTLRLQCVARYTWYWCLLRQQQGMEQQMVSKWGLLLCMASVPAGQLAVPYCLVHTPLCHNTAWRAAAQGSLWLSPSPCIHDGSRLLRGSCCMPNTWQASLRMAAGNCRLRSTGSLVQVLAPAAVCWAPGPVCHHVWPFIHSFVFLWGHVVEVVVCAMGCNRGALKLGTVGAVGVFFVRACYVVQPAAVATRQLGRAGSTSEPAPPLTGLHDKQRIGSGRAAHVLLVAACMRHGGGGAYTIHSY